MRARDPNLLASSEYDVLLVGGGIYGLTCAYEAASRGLRVALIDAADFGGGTSFHHQKTAHGGLRSLQSLSFGRARGAIRERRALARIAPLLLRPLPFIVGTYRSPMRSRTALRGAFAVDRWLGRDRNEGLEPELHLPAPRLLSRTATLKLFPGVRAAGLTGGAQWYDYQMVENDRLTLAFAAAAERSGADLASYVEAKSALRAGNRITGMHVEDVLTGTEFDVRARLVINAAGARAGEVMQWFGARRPCPVLKALNLVTSRPAADIALAAPAAHGRMLTLVPWRGIAIVGTAQSSTPVSDTSAQVTGEEVESFVSEANEAFPALRLHPSDVTLVHRGLVPARVAKDGTADLLPSSQIVDHRSDGIEGALTVIGAKYTTARAVAERATTLAARKLGTSIRQSRTATTMLPFAGIADHEALAIETGRRLDVDLDATGIRHLTGRYAEAAAQIVTIMAERPDTAAHLSPHSPTLAAEVLHAIRNEAAARLSDIVLRRTTMGAAAHPGADVLRRCAEIAAAELNWPPPRVAQEIAEVDGFYRVG